MLFWIKCNQTGDLIYLVCHPKISHPGTVTLVYKTYQIFWLNWREKQPFLSCIVKLKFEFFVAINLKASRVGSRKNRTLLASNSVIRTLALANLAYRCQHCHWAQRFYLLLCLPDHDWRHLPMNLKHGFLFSSCWWVQDESCLDIEKRFIAERSFFAM